MTKCYAGIGARKTPDDIQNLMDILGYKLASRGFCLRSGAAVGADTAFEKGCDRFGGSKQIFLPFDGFNGRHATESGLIVGDQKLGSNIASRYHKAWRHLKPTAKLMMSRNTFQVLGQDTRTPVDFILCWTPDGSLDGRQRSSGGTGQALRIAANYGIKVYNLSRDDHLAIAMNWVEETA